MTSAPGFESLACAFLKRLIGQAELPQSCRTFVSVNTEGEVRAALAFHHFTTRSCYADIGVEGGFLPPNLLRMGLWYAFGQLGLRRLTFFIAASNLKSISLVERLGAYREATLQDGCSDGDAYIYCLRPDKCPIWRKLNEQRQFPAPSS